MDDARPTRSRNARLPRPPKPLPGDIRLSGPQLIPSRVPSKAITQMPPTQFKEQPHFPERHPEPHSPIFAFLL